MGIKMKWTYRLKPEENLLRYRKNKIVLRPHLRASLFTFAYRNHSLSLVNHIGNITYVYNFYSLE